MNGPVAMGSDFNGVAGHVGPRFGNGACGGSEAERALQEYAKNRLGYPFTIPGFGTFDHQVSGQKIYDFNVDGLAHIGLLPDMVRDLLDIGRGWEKLQPLFGSAQAYITMWSKANQRPPAITSESFTTFTVGTAGSFTVTATGAPPPTFSETGVLPRGMTLDSTTGVLSGTPAAGTGGLYAPTFTASNGISPKATQLFVLRVTEAPAITSANTATFTVGTAGSFAVTATGFQVPTFSETGTLPGGVTLNSTTGVLSGTPAAGTGRVYSITITANNGVGTPATQTFTLTVDQVPAITSASAATFTVGTAGSFTIKATGFPAPIFTETGALPNGVTLNATTGVLSGTPAAGTGGVYKFTICACNGVLPDATQSFTLSVQDFTISASPASETISAGKDGAYTISVASLGGLAGSVSLTCSGAPPTPPALPARVQ
jgi:large repetitive protein